jgi:ABC-type oligopeptide transport system substrate-binding subunit
MKMKKSIALVLTLIFAACFAMTGCGKSSGTSSTMDKEQSISVAAIADVRSLDLNKATDA